MPYAANQDLPPAVRDHLPPHAQDIYREAFNHAYAAHAGDGQREQTASMIAWAAVKHHYEMDADGHWTVRSGSADGEDTEPLR